MPDMKTLARLMKELGDQLMVCMRCGLCQSVCPLFQETGREADVARGKLALLDGLTQEMFQDPQGVAARLDRCLLCGSCAAHCPSGVKALDIFLKARAILAGYRGLSPVKKVFFRGFLSHPKLFNRLLDWGARLQGICVSPVDDHLGSSCSHFLSPLLGERHFRALAPVPLHHQVAWRHTPPGPGRLKVAFFYGCLLDKLFPRVGAAVLEILAHHQVGVFLPEQGCCGLPALSSGDTVAFNRLVRYNLERFGQEPFDCLVTACASCAATLKKIWPLMAHGLSGEDLEKMGAMVEKTMDIHQFLVERVGLAPGGAEGVEKVRLTYHDPCHLKKSLAVAAQPRALIQANPRYQLEEMAEADWCCGCGGSFTLQHYEISAAIGRRKRDNIQKSGCAVVATACPACMLHLIDMLSQSGLRVQVKHAVEIYAEALKEGR